MTMKACEPVLPPCFAVAFGFDFQLLLFAGLQVSNREHLQVLRVAWKVHIGRIRNFGKRWRATPP